MSFLCDCHLHSHYSHDGRETLKAIADAAIRQGLDEICLTDHADVFTNPEENGCRGYRRCLLQGGPDYERLLQELATVREQTKGKLTIRFGLELGQPQANPKAAEELVSAYPFDFIIGSIHNMEEDDDLYYYDFGSMDREAFFRDYLKRELEMAEDYDFDVLGHCNYPLRYLKERGFSLEMMDFREEFRALFRTLIERGKGIEFNVSGLCRSVRVLLPDLVLIREYLALGGEIVTIGSDAHVHEQVGAPIREGLALLKEAGVRYIATYKGRKPVMHPIEGD